MKYRIQMIHQQQCLQNICGIWTTMLKFLLHMSVTVKVHNRWFRKIQYPCWAQFKLNIMWAVQLPCADLSSQLLIKYNHRINSRATWNTVIWCVLPVILYLKNSKSAGEKTSSFGRWAMTGKRNSTSCKMKSIVCKLDYSGRIQSDNINVSKNLKFKSGTEE
jgi:hypothetical protein